MAFENTITEQDMDFKSQQFVQGLRRDVIELEPDLSVDGLSESILSRIFGLFGVGRSWTIVASPLDIRRQLWKIDWSWLANFSADCDDDMWVSKPIYESLPYFYLLTGAICLGASMYLSHWYWPTICFVAGLVCLVAGLVVLLKRRDYRVTDRRVGQRQDY